jgi:hypothetical protein
MLVSTQKKQDNDNKVERIQSSQGDGGAPANKRERGELRRTALNKVLLQNHTHTPQDRETKNEERRQKRTVFIHPIDEETKIGNKYTSSYLLPTKCFFNIL